MLMVCIAIALLGALVRWTLRKAAEELEIGPLAFSTCFGLTVAIDQ
ncbi:hypothetical protein SAMN05446635_7221 [Burkholderia sp. OK233]|nr:hypothetical protein SAMN05446635_7221 [Burkholderia sp. OK233]